MDQNEIFTELYICPCKDKYVLDATLILGPFVLITESGRV